MKLRGLYKNGRKVYPALNKQLYLSHTIPEGGTNHVER